MPLNSMFDISDRIGAEGAQARQNMLARQAGNAMAGGDYNGAANVFYKGGDLASGQKVQEYSDVQRKQHAEGAQRIARGIRGLVASGVDPTTAYDHAMRLAPQLGIDPGDLQKLKPAYDKDPKAFLDLVDQQAKKELQIVNRGNGGYDVVDKQSGASSEASIRATSRSTTFPRAPRRFRSRAPAIPPEPLPHRKRQRTPSQASPPMWWPRLPPRARR
jgi:hypothetical protein